MTNLSDDLMGEAAALVIEKFETEGCPVGWMRDRLPDDAISILDKLPPKDAEVMGWVSDISVCIWFFPTVVRRSYGGWWAGLPGKWIDLPAHKWVLTHWRAI
jgi:hypothetical protein